MAALVRSSVSGQSRVPNPAARMKPFIKIEVRGQKSEVRSQRSEVRGQKSLPLIARSPDHGCPEDGAGCELHIDGASVPGLKITVDWQLLLASVIVNEFYDHMRFPRRICFDGADLAGRDVAEGVRVSCYANYHRTQWKCSH